MNKYIFIGNVTADAEVKTFENGNTIISFSVAINKSYVDANGVKQTSVTFVNCNLPVKKGEQPKRAQYILKGTKVAVVGEPKARAYVVGVETKSVLDCRVQELDLLSGPRTNGNQEQEQPSTESIGAVPTASNDNSGIPVDDLPF
jgi:single-strand DNA-binding protein